MATGRPSSFAGSVDAVTSKLATANLMLVVEETLHLCFEEGDAEGRRKLIRETGGLSLVVGYSEQGNEISIVFTADAALRTGGSQRSTRPSRQSTANRRPSGR